MNVSKSITVSQESTGTASGLKPIGPSGDSGPLQTLQNLTGPNVYCGSNDYAVREALSQGVCLPRRSLSCAVTYCIVNTYRPVFIQRLLTVIPFAESRCLTRMIASTNRLSPQCQITTAQFPSLGSSAHRIVCLYFTYQAPLNLLEPSAFPAVLLNPS